MKPILVMMAAVASLGLGALPCPAQEPKEKAAVKKEQVVGGIAFPPEDRKLTRISGKVKVLDAHTLLYEDGTEVDLNGGTDAPDLAQQGLIGDTFYPCGREAAAVLQNMIGDEPVTCFVDRDHVEGKKIRIASAFVGETNLNIEMVRNGWAVSHHSGMDPWEVIARENKRGMWRGEFVVPGRWRKGERLPGEVRETEAERKALAALQEFEPRITVDRKKPGKPVVAIAFRANLGKVTDNDLVHLKAFPDLRTVELPSKPITDAGLEQLAALPRLEELDLAWSKVTAGGTARLVKGLTKLQRLGLSGVPLRDEDLAGLKGLTDLRDLSLRGSLVTDGGLEHLGPFTKLRALSLMSTGVSDVGLVHLKVLTDLEDLDLDRTSITDAGLKHLEVLTRLRRLQMAHTAVTDAGLEHLRVLSDLKSLNLRGTAVTREGVDKLKQILPQLQVGFGPAPR
jgi:endonuclease YncB( thermonuclease family)